MPRTARSIIADGYYHILTRGNDRKEIFRCAEDFFCFLKLATETQGKHPLIIYHYCLMNNHVHFLVKAIYAQDLSKFFQITFQRYACYFRNRYNHVGYLFQNRYKSYLIDKESYLLECARYIERNPVRAHLVTYPGDYRWSSFLCYAQSQKDALIKELNPLYLELAPLEKQRQTIYKEYLLEERPYEQIVDKELCIG